MRTALFPLLSVLMFGCAVSAENADEAISETSEQSLKESSVPIVTLPNGQQVHRATEGARCFPHEQHFMVCSSSTKSASCEKTGNDFRWEPLFDCFRTFQVPCRETASGYGKCALAPRRGGSGEGASE